MRILLNALSARRGGGQTYVRNLLSFLSDGDAIEIFLIAPDSLAIDEGRKNIHRIPVRWPVENPFLRTLWERQYLVPLVSKTRADVLFCPGGIIGARVPPPCKTVTMFRNMIPFDPIHSRNFPMGFQRVRHRLLKKAMLDSMKQADLVIFVSRYAEQVFETVVGAPLRNTAVIQHGVNSAFRATENRDSPRPAWLPPDPYLLYVSDIEFHKSQLEVLRAYALLRKHRSAPEKLVFVGAESSRYARLVRSEIQRLRLGTDVLLAGQIPYAEMPALYHHALLNIFASKCENCPNILLESMASGRPLLVSNYPPMPEIAGNGAVYFDPASPEDLAHSLETVLTDPALLFELSKKAEKQSLLFDWHTTARDTWRAIESVCEKRHPEVPVSVFG